MKSTDNINMDGIGVHDELLKVLKNIKQGRLLEFNQWHTKHVITTDQLQYLTHLDIREISKREMMQRLGADLLEKYRDSFEERDTPYGKELSMSMLIMSMPELKHIVEFCIRTMPQFAIEEIRK